MQSWKYKFLGKELTPETKPVTKNENNIETHSQVLSHSSQQTEQVFPTSSITSSSNDNFISSNVPPIGQTNKPTDVSIPNLQDILKKKKGAAFVKELSNMPSKTNKDTSLLYRGPIDVTCVNCKEEFSSISSWHAFKIWNLGEMEGLGMVCSSHKVCKIYDIRKIMYKPRDTELGFIDFVKENDSLVEDIFIYTPLSPCCLCLMEIEKFVKQHQHIKISFYFKYVYKKSLINKINLKQLESGTLTYKLLCEGENYISQYKKIISYNIENQITFNFVN